MEKIEEKNSKSENVESENSSSKKAVKKRVQKHVVSLTCDERDALKKLTSRGKLSAREMKHAQLLLLSDINRPKGGQTDKQISELLNVNPSTVRRVRCRFVSQGIDSALKDKPRSGRPKFISGVDAAHVTALACSDPPEGHAKWSLRLLAEKVVELDYVETISHQTVSNILKKTSYRRT